MELAHIFEPWRLRIAFRINSQLVPPKGISYVTIISEQITLLCITLYWTTKTNKIQDSYAQKQIPWIWISSSLIRPAFLDQFFPRWDQLIFFWVRADLFSDLKWPNFFLFPCLDQPMISFTLFPLISHPLTACSDRALGRKDRGGKEKIIVEDWEYLVGKKTFSWRSYFPFSFDGL